MWTEKQLKLIEEGGNGKLREYFQTYELNDVYDIKIKYNTKAADYYRRMNNAKAMMKPFTEEIPTYDEGRVMMDGRKLDKDGKPIELSQQEKEDAGMTSNDLLLGSNGIQQEENKDESELVSQQAEVMNKMKAGIGALIGSLKTGAAYAHSQVMDPEIREQNKETLKTAFNEGTEMTKSGVSESAAIAKETVKSGAQSAREGAKYAGEKIYAGGAIAGSAVKNKLDETGVSAAAKTAADTVVTNAKYAGSVVNEKIEANPTLSNLKK